jgi:general secretion pathway protein G
MISRTHYRLGASRAFTLIELLVVIVILAILAAVVIPRVTGRVDDAKEAKAMTDIKSIESALENYKLDVGNYPSTDEGLQALMTNVANSPKWNKPYLNKLPADPWSNPYQYRNPGEANPDFDVFSAGADGQPGTSDDVTS